MICIKHDQAGSQAGASKLAGNPCTGAANLQYGNHSSRQGLVPSTAFNQLMRVECSQALKLLLCVVNCAPA